MSDQCFIPKCKNSIGGVQFPRDLELRQKWLEALNLTNATVTSGSFLCLSHFSPSDLLLQDVNSGKRPSNQLKRGAVPCNPEPCDIDVELQTEKVTNEDEDEDEVCRACLSNENLEHSVFDSLEEDVSISSAFMIFAAPIEITEQDNLPKKMCKPCLDMLEIANKFRKKCLESDEILRLNFKENRKRKLSNKVVNEKDKKMCLNLQTKAASTPSVLDISTNDAFELIYEESTSLAAKTNKLDIDEIEKHMEEIHGNKGSESDASETEALPQSDDENENGGSTLDDILSRLEDSSSSRDSDSFETNSSLQVSKPNVSKKIVVKSNFPIVVQNEVTLPHNIKLPKDVKIKPVVKYVSDIGVFPAVLRKGVYNSNFIQADEYLFELGLVKGSTRHLRCVVPNCGSHGKIKIYDPENLSSEVDIVIPHNHQAPDEDMKKKQMFLCLMRKKMQTDRTLNIRHIYEDACIQDPDIKKLVPLRNVINEICRHQLAHKAQPITTFEDFFCAIETDPFEKLHFTHNNQQFYQEKFVVKDDGSMAVVFGNTQVIQDVCDSKVMYVDASFKIDTNEDFKYQLVTILVWIDDSYYPILFALVNKKSQLIFRKVFIYLRDHLAPTLRPLEIVTDYEAHLYYALAETYTDSNIGGSVFYYTQNLYKKICSLNLSRDLETNSYFRNIYHMLLMLPLLPVNTILDGLNNVEHEARTLNIIDLTRPIFDHIRSQWIINVTPELFCVHKLENRINENVIAPFKKLRDFLLLTKGKLQKTHVTIVYVVEKIIELEAFLRETYSRPDKKSFGRDLSSYQKKNVVRAWQYIEDHPKIEITNFFSKVLGYIKCMENQLWIWGFYCFDGDTDDILIYSKHFSIVSAHADGSETAEESEEFLEYIEEPNNTIVMEAVVDQNGVLQAGDEISANENIATTESQHFESAFLKYVYK